MAGSVLRIGQSISHYRIVAKLGAGGMGEVYRATDTMLRRDVALKVLPPEMACDPGRLVRFQREARAIAALNHSHIVTIYSVEEADGVHFFTMELVAGQSLDYCIPNGGLPLRRLTEVAIALAEALAAAHAKGIVHRDLKPANVMLADDGRIKVLDLGLAKENHAPNPDDPTLTSIGNTEVGLVMGTPAYMSPEQIEGRPIDHRTDIYSFGVILYEMTTGQRPFCSDSIAGLMSAVLRDTPPAPEMLRSGIPGELDRIIMRSLAKEALDRPESAREVYEILNALRLEIESGAIRPAKDAVRVPRERRPQPSIAVLPFSDMSPARDHDWFCEGIAEEILNALTKIPGLRVATRTSAFRFKDPARDIARIGEALGVSTLLEGSLRTAGSQLRVTAQLVNARDGYHLWSERFDRQMEDVFAIQDEIAKKVVGALEVHLNVSAGTPSPALHSSDLEAYQLFLKGRHSRYGGLDLRGARRAFEQAVKLDSSYALARVALSETLVMMGFYGMIAPSESQARAREELKMARELDGESAAAWAVEALLALVYDWDMRASLKSFQRALELDPSSIPCRSWYTWALLGSDRIEDAVNDARRIAELDPQSPYANAMAGLAFLFADRVEEAVAFERRALELEPRSPLATWMMGLALAARLDWEEALEWFGHSVEVSSRASSQLGFLAWCQAASGRRPEALETLIELRKRADEEYVSPLFSAWAYSELGELARTKQLLQEAVGERSYLLVLHQMPCFRKLRKEPLMERLRRRLVGQNLVASG